MIHLGNYNSTWGVGQRGPDYDKVVTMPNAVKVPNGEIVNYDREKMLQREKPDQYGRRP